MKTRISTKYKSHKLYKKILYFVIFLFALILLILSTIVYIRNRRTSDENKEYLLKKDILILEYYSAEYFSEKKYNVEAADELIKNMFKQSIYLDHIIFYDNDREVIRYFSKGNKKINELPILTPEKLMVNLNKFQENKNDPKISITVIPISSNEKGGFIQIGLDNDFFNRTAADNLETIIITVLLAVLFSILLVSRMTNRIISPIREIIDAAEKVSKGVTIQNINKLNTNDEIEELVDSFNFITANLQARIKDLNTIQSIGLEISSELNKKELIKNIVKIFAKVTNCQRCALLLFGKEKQTLELFSGINLINNHYIVRFDEGIAGAVAQSGNYKTVDDISAYPDYQMFYKPEELNSIINTQTLALPLAVKDMVTGVICLTSKAAGAKFETAEIMLCQTIASSAAIALENANLYELAITDGLTKLYIHRFFQIKLQEEIDLHSKENKPLCLIMLDIDHFKKLNDTYGHPQGDVILQKVAEIIKESTRIVDVHLGDRRSDVVARYGGEEFAVILPFTDIRGAFTVAERIRLNIQEYEFPGPDKPLRITMSIGIAQFRNEISRQDFVSAADQALYISKNSGRNRSTINTDDV